MSKTAKLLSIISSAKDDDLYEEFVQVTEVENIETKKELGELWSDLIGYNPIEYHDRQLLDSAYEAILKFIPEKSMKHQMEDKKDEIIDNVIDNMYQIGETVLINELFKEISKYLPSFDDINFEKEFLEYLKSEEDCFEFEDFVDDIDEINEILEDIEEDDEY